MYGITSPKGFVAEGTHCGVRKNKSKLDLAIVKSEKQTTAAGTYTKNKFVAPPVVVTKDHIENSNPRVIVVNSGLANACTGDQGINDAEEMAKATAGELNIKKEEVVVGSTGLIGEYLPVDRIKEGIKELIPRLSKEAHKNAALAIMTTDTKPKEAKLTVEIDGKEITLGGMSKGSGMIYPNMATMFSFITTDCAISKELLQKSLSYTVDRSYNLMTVDGDTSTNDMVIALANGEGGNSLICEEDDNYYKFRDALLQLNKELSMKIVSDGEGTTKVIKLTVRGAKTFEDAKKIIMTVLNSNLVKTAFFGEDANWGRIIMAMGNSGADFDPNKVNVFLGDVQVVQKGKGVSFSEERASEALAPFEVSVLVDLDLGSVEATGYGSDLSYEYVKINAEYRS